MLKSAFPLIIIWVFSYPAFGQFFSENCNGAKNILPVENINLCNNSEWVLVFEDNFDGDSLDRGIWKRPSDQQGSTGTEGELQYNTLDNAVVEDGILKITAKEERLYALAVSWRDSFEVFSDGLTNIRWFDYTTAKIISIEKFGFGRFEASCKIPPGKGFWPAMWMYGEPMGPDNYKIPEEIDVFEFWNNETDNHNMNVIYNNQACLSDYSGPDFSRDFHTFTMIWEPYKIDWYMDGEHKKHFPRYYQNGSEVGCRLNAWQTYQETPFPKNPLSLIFNLTIDNRDGFEPDASTPFPGILEIDWIRYYARADLLENAPQPQFYSMVYPNPCSRKVTIEIEDTYSGDTQYTILSPELRPLKKQLLIRPVSCINLEKFDNGFYIIQIVNQKTSQVNHHKIMIIN